MSSSVLKNAYQQIKDGNKTTALLTLKPYVKEHPNDPNGWWLLANATKDPDQRRRSLERAVELDPSFAPAQKALRKLSGSSSSIVEYPKRKTNQTEKSQPKAKKSNRTETIIGIVLVSLAVILLVCGGIFYAISQGTSAIFDEIAQNVTIEYSEGSSASFSSSGGSGNFPGIIDDIVQKGSIQVGDTVQGSRGILEANAYQLQGRAGQRITIELTATNDGDPVLYLYDLNNELLEENDDIEFMENYNSRIVATLPADGTYTIIANGFGEVSYRLSVR